MLVWRKCFHGGESDISKVFRGRILFVPKELFLAALGGACGMLFQKFLKMQWLRLSENVFEPAEGVQSARQTLLIFQLQSNSNFL